MNILTNKQGKETFYLNNVRVVDKKELGNILLCDLETCNNEKTLFDFSYRVVDTKQKKVIERGSFILNESWFTRKVINGCYSKNKKKHYKKMLDSGIYKGITREELNNLINTLVSDYNIKVFSAYNGAFDLESLYRTFSIENKRTKFFKNSVLNKDSKLLRLHLLDIGTACHVFYETQDFQEWYDKEIGERTKNGLRRVTCEIMTKYLLKDGFFIEEHTGQRDLDVEYQLLMAVLGREDVQTIALNLPMLWGANRLATKMLNENTITYQALYNGVVKK